MAGHTQGRSHSDPDGMTNGGPDKPGCSGGVNALDQDGNNGCGNDLDREDDNNGNCGRQKTAESSSVPSAKPKAEGEVEVEGETHERGHLCSGHTMTTSTAAGSTTSVAGMSEEKCSCALGSEAQFSTPAKVAAQVAGTTSVSATGTTTPSPETSVSAAGSNRTAAGVTTPTTAPGTQVLGETLSRPSALARTGAGVGVMALLGVVLCGSGRLALLARRLLHLG
jgi:hypothetical protein